MFYTFTTNDILPTEAWGGIWNIETLMLGSIQESFQQLQRMDAVEVTPSISTFVADNITLFSHGLVDVNLCEPHVRAQSDAIERFLRSIPETVEEGSADFWRETLRSDVLDKCLKDSPEFRMQIRTCAEHHRRSQEWMG